MKEKVLAIVGPTASGKTALSIKIAQKYNGEVISADSRQVYKGLDIGTEKVTASEMQGVPHHLIDVIEPNKTFTVKNFVELAQDAIQDIASRRNLPIIAGGAGFYIDALLYNLEFPEVPPNEMLRKVFEEKDEQELFDILMEKDAERAATIDPHNKRRLVRALEIVAAVGRVPSTETNNPVYDSLILGIRTEENVLRERIEKRLLETCKKGLVEEVSNLHKGGLSWERLSEFGLEYRVASEFIRGETSDKEMHKKMVSALQQYAKRQMTWFRRNENINWVSLHEQNAIEHMVEDFLKRV